MLPLPFSLSVDIPRCWYAQNVVLLLFGIENRVAESKSNYVMFEMEQQRHGVAGENILHNFAGSHQSHIPYTHNISLMRLDIVQRFSI